MTSLTVRNLPDDAKHRFRQVAAAHGRSMEEHLRQLVITAACDGDAWRAPGVADVQALFRHAVPDARVVSRARIEALLERGRGLDFEPPPRIAGTVKTTDFA